MFEFKILTAVIAIVSLWGFGWAVFRLKDVFHPLAVLMPMVLYLYAYMPMELLGGNEIELNFFTDQQWTLAQAINLLCILALVAGCIVGGKWKTWQLPPTFPPAAIEKVYRFGIVMGSLSLVAYAININNVGGIFEAYSREKGGGTAESGYLRDAIFWVIPAVGSMAFCGYQSGVHLRFVTPAAIFAVPLVIHGILGARRGPTFMIFAALAVAWFLANRKRPPLLVFMGAGATLGILLLLIVNFRSQFRIGSDLFSNAPETLSTMLENLDEAQESSRERTLGGNEFVYGANVMLSFNDHGNFYWGTRLLTILFIRPIPKQVWPTKYEDVGMERYLVNVGLGSEDDLLMPTTYGAAPGFVADMFAEFSWGAILAAFLVGWGYGRTWRSAVSCGDLALILYVLLFSLSIFFILQTMEAIVFRLVFTAVPLLVFWRMAMHRQRIPFSPLNFAVAKKRVVSPLRAAPARLPQKRSVS